MIIGSGLIANSLKNIDAEDILFFASGVSNSLETRNEEFEREFSLLKNSLEKNPEKKTVYFSTLSIHDDSKQQSLYVLHKLTIEEYIKRNCSSYVIVRIGNIVGKGGNPNTLFNFLKTKILHKELFTIHSKAKRLLIDIEDIPKFLNLYLPKLNNQTISLSYPHAYSLKEMITSIESQTSMAAAYETVEEGCFYLVNFEDVGQNFFINQSPKQYLEQVTRKYITQ